MAGVGTLNPIPGGALVSARRQCSGARIRPDGSRSLLFGRMFTMRFDMRAPGGAAITDRYRAAIEMVEFAETRGGVAAVLSEHHASPDGYLPSPLLLASAMAARTNRIHLAVSAVLLPFADPVRLAEEMVILDIVSGGRMSFTCGLGYRAEEFEHFGLDRSARGRLADEKIDVLLRAKTGEPFEYEGRRIHVTPAPVTPGGPTVIWGGVTVAGARRAGRYGLDYSPAVIDPAFDEAYAEGARESGRPPGRVVQPRAGAASVLFVADDLDRAWEEVGPYLLHDAEVYGAWNRKADNPANGSSATTLEGLRAERGSHQIVAVEEAIEMVRGGQRLGLHPMCGGIPPEIAWPYLRRVTDEVLPRASSPGGLKLLPTASPRRGTAAVGYVLARPLVGVQARSSTTTGMLRLGSGLIPVVVRPDGRSSSTREAASRQRSPAEHGRGRHRHRPER